MSPEPDALSVEASDFPAGDLPRLADSMNQCLMDASWLIIASCRRLGRRFVEALAGIGSSGLVETSWSVLPLERRRSRDLGGGGGRCREELVERIESFSIGGGGVEEAGDSMAAPSGNLGRSGMTI